MCTNGQLDNTDGVIASYKDFALDRSRLFGNTADFAKVAGRDISEA